MVLFKYLSSEYLRKFIKDGEILFRTLAYFRHFEDEEIRGDEYDGTWHHAKETGLTITKQNTGETLNIPFSFDSCVNSNEIFVFCMSIVHSAELYNKFNADVCVEITDYDKFISRIKVVLKRSPTVKPKTLLHGSVDYYSEDEAPMINWALPEKIVMSKRKRFIWQNEYRLAFSIRNALKFGNTKQYLVKAGTTRKETIESFPSRIVRIGNLENIAKVHKIT